MGDHYDYLPLHGRPGGKLVHVKGEQVFRRALRASGLMMLVGIAMLIGTAVLQPVPLWWTRMAAILTIAGAALELLAVWRFLRSRV